eukprot:Em0020g855a
MLLQGYGDRSANRRRENKGLNRIVYCDAICIVSNKISMPKKEDAINHVLAESKYANLVPSAEQWLAAEKLSALLKSFQIATDFLQGEKYPTLGGVSRFTTTLLDGLQADEEEDNDSESPAKKPALTSEEADFDLLFGQKKDSEAEGQVQSDDHLQHLQDELDRYLKEAEINFRKDDPLLWWRSHETYFPTIAKLARKYLCIPASTASSERLFSTAKNILQKKRWRPWRILPERPIPKRRRPLYATDPEKKKASVRNSYKVDPEKKKASVRDSYKADPEKKKASRYQEDVEENRAAKRQKYEDNSAAIKASERNRYWNDPAVRLVKRAAERKRYRRGHRTTTTTQSYSLYEPKSHALMEYNGGLEKAILRDSELLSEVNDAFCKSHPLLAQKFVTRSARAAMNYERFFEEKSEDEVHPLPFSQPPPPPPLLDAVLPPYRPLPAAALPPPPAAAAAAAAAAELPSPPPAAAAELPPPPAAEAGAPPLPPPAPPPAPDTSAPTTTSPAAPLAAATTTHMAPMARTRPPRP